MEKIDQLENSFTQLEKHSISIELELQHKPERLQMLNVLNENSSDLSLTSRLEKLENENVSLEFKVRNLGRENEDLKLKYKDLFDSFKQKREEIQTSHASSRAKLFSENSDLRRKVLKLQFQGNFVITKGDKQEISNTVKRKPQPPLKEYMKYNKNLLPSTGLASSTIVSRPQPKSTQVKDRVVQTTKSIGKMNKQTQVEEHLRISKSFKNKKHVAIDLSAKLNVCNDNVNVLNALNENVNAVCISCGLCVVDANHDKYTLDALSYDIVQDLQEESIDIIEIKADIYCHESPLCLQFNEFNHLSKIDEVLFTHEIVVHVSDKELLFHEAEVER
ncbi:hypothetical protein Tco_0365816 [Tanacetum coccineum]